MKNELNEQTPVSAPFLRIDHVQLAMPAGQEDQARAFYVEILGLVEIAKPPELAKRGGAWFMSGQVAVHIGVDVAFNPAKKAHPAFRCANYAELVNRLNEHGISVVPDDLLFEGMQHCYISDPFGNRLELIDS